MEKCFFKPCLKEQDGKPLSTAGAQRISTIIKTSQKRQDDLHIELERRLIEDKHLTIKCHRGCALSYTSNSHIQRHLKRIHTADLSSINGGPTIAAKRFCRSDLPDFCFKRHCLFCGMDCIMDHTTKNPSRWRQVYLCRAADRGKKTTIQRSDSEGV